MGATERLAYVGSYRRSVANQRLDTAAVWDPMTGPALYLRRRFNEPFAASRRANR